MGWGKKEANPETCAKCPYRYDAQGCPCWIGADAGFMETNVQTGEERLVTGCFYQVIPKLMIHVVKASNRPAAAVESTRNEIAAGMRRIGEALSNKVQVELVDHAGSDKKLSLPG